MQIRLDERSDAFSGLKGLLTLSPSLPTGSGEGDGKGAQSGTLEGHGAPYIVECRLQLDRVCHCLDVNERSNYVPYTFN